VRFFLDENISRVSLDPLRAIFVNRHEFVHASDLGLTGVDDVDLYPEVAKAGVDAIISKDGRQLKNQNERRGLYDHHLSFVHLLMKETRGYKGLSLELAALTASLPYIEEEWATATPKAFRVKGLQSGFKERVSSHVPLWLDSWSAAA
jgi:hypothetical protein